MRVLILGGDGMLGHRLMLDLSKGHEVQVTLRRDLEDYRGYGIFTAANSLPGIDARNTMLLLETICDVRPDVVVNAVGIVKQRRASTDVVRSLEINALLPHRLAMICKTVGARLIHISTDCVFAGDRGNYVEDDVPDAVDLYGRSKQLGEVDEEGSITLRTSIIGLELSRRRSLIEWYLQQSGRIEGFTGAIYSGLTTLELSRVIRMIMQDFPELHGVYNVVGEPISKHDLLEKLTGFLKRSDLEIAENHEFKCDRSMIGDRFAAATGYKAPGWDTLLSELADTIEKR